MCRGVGACGGREEECVGEGVCVRRCVCEEGGCVWGERGGGRRYIRGVCVGRGG